MIISGDRIVGAVGALLQRPGIRARLEGVDRATIHADDRREVREEGATSV
jgi:hypothetical protein